MKIEKTLTDNPFIDELLYCIKQIAYGAILKNEEQALKYETADSIKNADLYIASLENRAVFELFTYDRQVLEASSMPNTLISDCLRNRDNIPLAYRDELTNLMMQRTITNFVETNEYYRMICGLPKRGVEGIKLTNYLYMIPEGSGIDMTLYVHQMVGATARTLDSYGVIEALINDYPDQPYLKYLTAGITSYNARKAENFQILYTPDSESLEINDKFRNKFEQNRSYILRTVYSEAYKYGSDYYDNFMMIFMIIQTMIDMLSEVQDHIVKKDILDARCIEYIFSCYGIPYYHEIPIKYQIAMVKNVNSLIKYKSSAQGMLNLCSLFGCDDIRIFKYFLLRDRRVDVYGDYLFNYKEQITSEENDRIKNITIDTDKPETGEITVPFPFADYLAKGNVMFIRLDGKVIDETEYNIYNTDKLEFNNPAILDGVKKITYDFYYDIYTINKEYQQTDEYAVTTTVASIAGQRNDQYEYVIPVPYPTYLNDGNGFIVSMGSTFVSTNLYEVNGGKINFDPANNWTFEGRDINFIFIYGNTLKVGFVKSNVTANRTNQMMFDIPEPFANYLASGNQFFVTIGSTFIDPRRYKVENKKLIFLNESDAVDIGRILSFNFIYNKNNTFNSVNLKKETITLTATEYYQHEFSITYPCDNYLERGHKVFIKLLGWYLESNLYELYSNKLVLKDRSMALQPGDEISIVFVYNNDDNVTTTSTYQLAKTDKQTEFDIAYPIENYFERGNALIINVEGIYLDPSMYTITGTKLKITNPDYAAELGQNVIFTFVYSKTNIYNLTLKNFIMTSRQDGQTKFAIKFPFYKYMDSKNGYMLMHGSVLIDPSRYKIEGYTLELLDFSVPKGQELVLMFIYSTIYEKDNKALIVEWRTVNVAETIEDNLIIPMPLPFDDYIQHEYPYFLTNNKMFIKRDDYEAINESVMFIDPKQLLAYETLTFTFIYIKDMLTTKIIEDYGKDYDLKFVKAPIDDIESDKYIKKRSNYMNYDSITLADPLWDGQDNLHEEIKRQILEKEFNYARTKYMSIDAVIDITAMAFEISYFYNMFYDDVLAEELLTVTMPCISESKKIKINDLFCYMTALAYTFTGIKDSIMDTPTKVMYVKGFNFRADMNKLRQYILDNRRLIKDFDVFNYMMPDGQVPTIGELLNIFRTNKSVYQYICANINESRDYEEYKIWKTLYDSLMITKFNLTFFTLKNGQKASTFTEFLEDRDKVLYNSLQKIRAIQDEETRQNTIVTMLSDIVYVLDEFISSKEFKYIYSNMPGISKEYILKYLFKMINFFKSYKVHLFEMNIMYILNDKAHNTIRPMDRMAMTIKLEKHDMVNISEKMTNNQYRTMKDRVNILEKLDIKYF